MASLFIVWSGVSACADLKCKSPHTLSCPDAASLEEEDEEGSTNVLEVAGPRIGAPSVTAQSEGNTYEVVAVVGDATPVSHAESETYEIESAIVFGN
jgi:hypothetical protein